MSRIIKYRVAVGQNPGWFAIYDTVTRKVATEIRGRAEANRRCRQMNTAEDAERRRPAGYVDAACSMCGCGLTIPPNSTALCRTCEDERDEIEARDEILRQEHDAEVALRDVIFVRRPMYGVA